MSVAALPSYNAMNLPIEVFAPSALTADPKRDALLVDDKPDKIPVNELQAWAGVEDFGCPVSGSAIPQRISTTTTRIDVLGLCNPCA
jgi:hypothetical protein